MISTSTKASFSFSVATLWKQRVKNKNISYSTQSSQSFWNIDDLNSSHERNLNKYENKKITRYIVMVSKQQSSEFDASMSTWKDTRQPISLKTVGTTSCVFFHIIKWMHALKHDQQLTNLSEKILDAMTGHNLIIFHGLKCLDKRSFWVWVQPMRDDVTL